VPGTRKRECKSAQFRAQRRARKRTHDRVLPRSASSKTKKKCVASSAY
jgi:hypothetical protein